MERSAHRSHLGRVAAIAVAGILAVPAQAAAVPALDEYIFDPPDAGGKKQNVERAPGARTKSLDPAVARALARDPDGKALAAIATSPELGAPDAPATGGAAADVDSADPGVLGAAVKSAGDPAAVAVIAALIAVGAAYFFARRRQGQS